MATEPPHNNPYQPGTDPSAMDMDQPLHLPDGQRRGMVGQTTVLGVLMIVQGILNSLAGVAAGFYAFFMPQIMTEMRADMAKQAAGNGGGNGAAPPPLPENFEQMFLIGGSVFAVALLFLGILSIFGGIGVMRLERRGLAITSLCLGMLTIATCYCFPTSLALGIYGLILLLNQPVMQAFSLRAEGYPVRRIQAAFMSLP